MRSMLSRTEHLWTVIVLLTMLLSVSVINSAGGFNSFLPIVTKQTSSTTAMIYECQCGAVQAKTLPNGWVELTIQDHSRGGAVVVGVDDGIRFREYQNTPMSRSAGTDNVPSPSFQYPGLKQGIGDTVDAFGAKVTYAPNRIEISEGEFSRYNIWRFVYQPVLPIN